QFQPRYLMRGPECRPGGAVPGSRRAPRIRIAGEYPRTYPPQAIKTDESCRQRGIPSVPKCRQQRCGETDVQKARESECAISHQEFCGTSSFPKFTDVVRNVTELRSHCSCHADE